jgi:hypothetical protein
MDNLDFLDVLTILSFIVGLQNLELNKQQVDGVMDELQNVQNSMLSTIIQQNEEIIRLLKENKND